MGKATPFDRHDKRVSTLGSLLKARREAAGLSITQVAVQIGVSRPYLSRLERDQYAHPSPQLICRIAKRLDIDPEDLYAVTGYLLPTGLPSFGPYLRTKHPDWPDMVLTELTDFYEFLEHKYGLK